ncbi:MAG: peptidylprolyl isomerase [Akkermansiaceae bacterium]|nr:peptidylprolyl isomerase [Akkermansiaceae bacterium]
MFVRSLSCLAASLVLAAPAFAKAPKAPTKLRAKAVGSNAFQLKWKDNSKDETGWEIRVALQGGKPSLFKRIPTPDLTQTTILTNDLAGKTIVVEVAAYKGKEGKEKVSKPTNTASATALSPATFVKPGKLKVRAIDDGRILLKWKDKSTSEETYQVQMKRGKGQWLDVAFLDPDKKFKLVVPGLEPEQDYQFRVRALKDGGATTTPFSRMAKAKTKSLRAPKNLVARNGEEGQLAFRWKDKSSVESGFELEQSISGAAFTKLGDIGADSTGTEMLDGFFGSGNYRFRIRAFRNGAEGRSYSSYSNTVRPTPVPLGKPVDFVGNTTGSTTVRLMWKGNSKLATGYQIYAKFPGADDFSYLGYAPVDDPVADVEGLSVGKSYEFKVRAVYGLVASAFTPSVRLLTEGAAVTSGAIAQYSTADGYEYQVTVTDADALDSLTVTGLPAGVTYSAATRMISGVATEEGVWNVVIEAKFFDGTTHEKTVVLRTVRQPAAPVVDAGFATVGVAVSEDTSVPLAGHFSDPDTGDARRVTTPLGSFDIILYPLATPATVANFLAYADAGRYQKSFFHRSPSNFVIQGGGFTYDAVDGFSKLVTDPAVVNEPGISNVAATVAMAKLPGDPNSATSQFFASIGDNSSNLDGQNGGFTVFGRVAGDGMSVVNAINLLPTKTYTVDVDGTDQDLDDVPMNDATAPATIDPTKLVGILSVDPVALVSYSVDSLDPSVATASVVGGNVVIHGVSQGSTEIVVTATDLDGQTVSSNIAVTVGGP